MEDEKIRVAIVIKIRCTHHYPAGRKSWTEATSEINVVVQIPDRGLMGAGVVKHVVRVAVTVKVGCARQFPTTGKARPVSASNAGWSRQIPNCSLISTRGKQAII